MKTKPFKLMPKVPAWQGCIAKTAKPIFTPEQCKMIVDVGNQCKQEEAKMIEDGKLKEALDIVKKERDDFKVQAEQWNTYQTSKRESLMGKLTEDDDKSIAEGLSLDKLEKYVSKVVNVSAPSTSSARATTGKAGEMGGYSSYAEWAQKDPKGYQEANNSVKGTGIKIGY